MLVGTWIRADRPNESEQQTLVQLGIDEDILLDALDPHEVPRVETEDGWTYFITRLPDTDDEFNDFTTPILFALGDKHIATISRDSYRAVIDTKLNETVRILTVITLALTIPTMMAGLYGMNVELPEWATGGIDLVFIGTAIASSIAEKKAAERAKSQGLIRKLLGR